MGDGAVSSQRLGATFNHLRQHQGQEQQGAKGPGVRCEAREAVVVTHQIKPGAAQAASGGWLRAPCITRTYRLSASGAHPAAAPRPAAGDDYFWDRHGRSHQGDTPISRWRAINPGAQNPVACSTSKKPPIATSTFVEFAATRMRGRCCSADREEAADAGSSFRLSSARTTSRVKKSFASADSPLLRSKRSPAMRAGPILISF